MFYLVKYVQSCKVYDFSAYSSNVISENCVITVYGNLKLSFNM